MKTYTDNRPFEECIRSTTPTGKYKYISDMIRRDPNIFRGDHTIYDSEIERKKEEFENLKKQIPELEKMVEGIVEKLGILAKGKVKEISGKDFEGLFGEKLEMQGKIKEKQEKIEDLKQEINLWRRVQTLTRMEFVTLSRIGRIYKTNGDDDFLERGVEWCCHYADCLLDRIPNVRNSVPGLIRPTYISTQNLNGGAW